MSRRSDRPTAASATVRLDDQARGVAALPLAAWLLAEPPPAPGDSQALFALYGTLITALASIGVAYIVNRRGNKRDRDIANPSPADVPQVLGYYQDCRRDLEAAQHRIRDLEDELDDSRSLAEFLLRRALDEDGGL